MGNVINIAGNKYGLLTVIKISGKQQSGYKLYLWECLCECGNTIHIPKHYLTSGDTKSCGCIGRRFNAVKHGKSNHRLYNIWRGMRQRCYDEKHPAYPNYGGRGIKICKRWRYSFPNFFNDMWESYIDGYSIERVNNNGNYTKRNTKWIPMVDQAKNRRTAVIVTYKGVTKSVTELCKTLNIDSKLIFQRLNKGFDIDTAINLPKQKNQFYKSKINP